MAKARCKRYLQYLSRRKGSEISGKNGFFDARESRKKDNEKRINKLQKHVKVLC
jgi:hypothetical protein